MPTFAEVQGHLRGHAFNHLYVGGEFKKPVQNGTFDSVSATEHILVESARYY
jgi:hypothetical protein